MTPTENVQTFYPDTGYSGISTVTVGAISTTYVGSGVARKSSSDLTVNGASITVPAGYYETATTKSVQTATAGTISVSINASGLMTATATASAGYYAGGTKTATAQVSTQAGKTVTPSAATQTVVAAGKYTTGDVKVASVPVDINNSFTTNGTKTPASGK